MPNTELLLLFVAAIAILLFAIIRLKINPFLVLPGVGLLTGIASGLPLATVAKLLGDGFGQTLGSIGMVIGLGIILGNLLADARATEQIAALLLRVVGVRRAPLAVNITGYLVSIPVFLNAAFIVFMPLLRDLSRTTRLPLVTLVTAYLVAGIGTHCIVPPTPGPLAVMGALKLDPGPFIGWGMLVALLPMVVGLIAGNYFGKQPAMQIAEDEQTATALTPAADTQPRPSGGLSLFLLLFPILLILVGSLTAQFLPETSQARKVLAFVGDKNVAMLVGLALAGVMLSNYRRKSFEEIVADGGANAGLLILIVGAGGSFGAIINGSGIADALVGALQALNLSMLWLAFLLTAILRAAQGSATVSAVTTASLLAPMIAPAGASPLMVGLAICCGSMCCSFPNDSGFWVISRFSGLNVNQMLRVWTLTSSVAGIAGFVVVLILNALLG
ncbi:MAG: GntP family permease [Cytophagales bacterium]|nr:MAG: GntP family permease [Cytophagales bacterium]